MVVLNEKRMRCLSEDSCSFTYEESHRFLSASHLDLEQMAKLDIELEEKWKNVQFVVHQHLL